MSLADTVRFGAGQLAALPHGLPVCSQIFLLTDRNVEPLLKGPWGDTPRLVIPAGESSKSWATLERLLRALDETGMDRDALLVAVGGGVVTDLGGLAASLHRRGMPWVAVPTSVVGQVDAALGGKTAINLGGGKNTVGSFHLPLQVILDPDALRSLSDRCLRAGFAELLKTALIVGGPLWEVARELTEVELRQAAPRATQVMADVVSAKLKLVEGDPYDRGSRRLLNLGHSFGHAFEALSLQAAEQSSPTRTSPGIHDGHLLEHGEAVGLGLLCACRLGTLLADPHPTGPAPALPALEGSLRTQLQEWQLPIATPFAVQDVLKQLTRDKKRAAGTHTLVALHAPGRVAVHSDVPESFIREALQAVHPGA